MVASHTSMVLLLSALAGCADTGTRTGPSPGVSGSTERPSASTPNPSASAAASAASPTSALRSEQLGGVWTGRYESKRAKVALPKGSPWPAWRKDDGKRLGQGVIELTVEASGEVHGAVSGALGTLNVRGRVEDGVLRAGVTAEEPRGEIAMVGRLVATLKDDSMKGELRASDEHGETVRIAEVLLRRRGMR